MKPCSSCGKRKHKVKGANLCFRCHKYRIDNKTTRVFVPEKDKGLLSIYFDGGTKGCRVCVYDEYTKKKIVKVINGERTNNELEYYALLIALRYYQRVYSGYKNIRFIGDSALIIKQVTGKWNVRNERLIMLYEQVIEELKNMNFTRKCKIEKIIWMPRDKNKAGILLDDLK